MKKCCSNFWGDRDEWEEPENHIEDSRNFIMALTLIKAGITPENYPDLKDRLPKWYKEGE